MAVKRRVLWLDDEAWEAAERQARPFLMTRSAYIRSLIVGGRLVPAVVRDAMDAADIAGISSQPPRPMTQAERDAILRRVNKG